MRTLWGQVGARPTQCPARFFKGVSSDHLFINEINRSVPIWLNEGIASFEGGTEGYRKVCRNPAIRKLLEAPPSLADLESSYSRLPAADVTSFALVDFIVTTRGMPALNELLRNPPDYWHKFARTGYR